MKTYTLRIFRFNAKTDYLSYYKPYRLELNSQTSAREILELIRQKDLLFTSKFESENYIFVDDKCLHLDEKFSVYDDLKLSALAPDFSTKDFELNNIKFLEKLNIFNDLSQADKDFYNENRHYYYASKTRKFAPSFLGEPIFLLASRLIQNHPAKELEILKKISDISSGIWNYTSLANIFADTKDLDDTINHLKKKIFDYGIYPNLEKRKNELYLDFLSSNEKFFDEDLGLKSFNAGLLTGLNVSVYLGNYANTFRHIDLFRSFKEKELNLVNTSFVYESCALESFYVAPQNFYNQAGIILLDAFDNGANVLVSPWKKFISLARTHKHQIEQAAGRKIDLDLIHTSELV